MKTALNMYNLLGTLLDSRSSARRVAETLTDDDDDNERDWLLSIPLLDPDLELDDISDDDEPGGGDMIQA